MSRVLYFLFLVVVLSFNTQVYPQTGGNWVFFTEIIIDNTGYTFNLTDYQVQLNINTEIPISQSKMNADCSDIRFINSNSDTLHYWIEDNINTNNTMIWVKVNEIDANSCDTIIMIYGNLFATEVSNGDSTFLVFDDFDDGIIAPEWTVNVDGWTEQNGYLQSSGNGMQTYPYISVDNSQMNCYFSYDFQWTVTPTSTAGAWHGFKLNDSPTDDRYATDMRSSGEYLFFNYPDGLNHINTSWTANTEWHHQEIYRDQIGNWKVILDQNVKGEFTDNLQTFDMNGFSGPSDGWGFSGDIRVDSFFVAQYVTPSPTYTIGDEQLLNPLIIDAMTANPERICEGDSSQLNVTISGGSGTITYQWVSNPAGFNSTIQNPVVYPNITTWYIVTVTDDYSSSMDSIQVIVDPLPQIYNLIGGGSYCLGSPGVDIGLDNSETGFTYELYINGNPSGLIQQGTGNTIWFTDITVPGSYTINGYNDYCSQMMNGSTNVTVVEPYQEQEICLVTVDSLNNTNMVVWEGAEDENIVSFIIYRESNQTGIYDPIDTIPISDQGIYLDGSSNPTEAGYRYKVSIIDTCGNESSLSNYHQTIHLVVNQNNNNWDLEWNHYEGFDYDQYSVRRKEQAGVYIKIDSVPGDVNSYTDVDAPAGMLQYLITADKDIACNPSPTISLSESMSNVAYAIPVNMNEYLINDNTVRYSTYEHALKIDLNKLKKDIYHVFLININGQVILTTTLSKGDHTINTGHLAKGIYAVQVKSSSALIIRKVLIN